LVVVILKYGSANIMYVGSTALVPLTNAAFSLQWVPGHQPVHPTDILGLVVIMLGIFFYRFVGYALASPPPHTRRGSRSLPTALQAGEGSPADESASPCSVHGSERDLRDASATHRHARVERDGEQRNQNTPVSSAGDDDDDGVGVASDS
jgi:hypothetical protein